MAPSISKFIDTLDSVSSFHLLDIAFKDYNKDLKLKKINEKKSKIILTLIGESARDITARNIYLSARVNRFFYNKSIDYFLKIN